MKPNQSSSSTNYSQQIPSANLGNQLPFNLNDNFIQQVMNMKQEIDQLKVSQNIQNMKHQIEMNQMKQQHNLEMNQMKQQHNLEMKQMKKSMFNQENKHDLEMKQIKKSMFNQENKHNLEMKNIINKFQRQETMLREEIRVQSITSQAQMENRFKLVNKEISDLKTNYSNLNQEISKIKSSEELLNSIKPLLKNLSNNLTSFNEKNNSMEIMILKKRVDDIELKISEFLKDNTTLEDRIGTLCQQISLLIKEINTINSKFNGEIIKLGKQVQDLSQKNKELQLIIISRKLVKIILKYIISNCLLSFTRENKSNNLKSLVLKALAPFKQEDVINTLNELIEKNRNTNEVMHIEEDIYNNLEILKGYGREIILKDLIEMLNVNNKVKLSLSTITKFFKIDGINVYNDIIYFDPEMTEMLNDLQSKLQNNYINNSYDN